MRSLAISGATTTMMQWATISRGDFQLPLVGFSSRVLDYCFEIVDEAKQFSIDDDFCVSSRRVYGCVCPYRVVHPIFVCRFLNLYDLYRDDLCGNLRRDPCCAALTKIKLS